MKTIILISVYLLNIVFLTEKGKCHENLQSVILEVKLNEARSIGVEVRCSLPSFSQFFNQVIKLETDKEGLVRFKINKQAPIQELLITIGDNVNKSVLIENGLMIQVDEPRGDRLHYFGPDAKLNRYIDSYEAINVVVSDDNVMGVVDYSYVKHLDSLFHDARDADLAFVRENPSVYSKLIFENRNVNYYNKLLVYHWSNGVELEDAIWNEIINFSPEILSHRSSYFFYSIQTYIKRLKVFTKYVTNGYPKFGKEDWREIKSLSNQDKSNERFSEEELVEKYTNEIFTFLTIKIAQYCENHLPKNISEKVTMAVNLSNDIQYTLYYKHVLSKMESNELVSEANRIFSEKAEKIKIVEKNIRETDVIDRRVDFGILKMKTDFNASLFIFNGTTKEELLSLIQNVTENKVMFLDFWAVWCKPCMEGMPKLKTLQNSLKDQLIDFVYLCTSNSANEDIWMQKIVELRQPGIHIFVNERVISELMSSYGLVGYPSYLVSANTFDEVEKVNNLDIHSADKLKKIINRWEK